MFRLAAVTGELAGQSVDVDGALTVGRAEECDLVLADRRLSRRHARFYVDGEHWYVEDLGSPNGTLVNRRRVRKAKLTAGDTITLSKTTFRVEGDPEAADDPTQPPVPPPQLVKPVGQALPPDLASMVAEDYFKALGLGDDTLHDTSLSTLTQLVAKTRSFALLHEVSKTMQRAHEPQAMLTMVLDLLLKATGGERAYAVLVKEDGGIEVPVTRVVDGAAVAAAPPVSSTVVEHVIEGRSSILCADATADDRFESSASLFLNETRALVAAPMLLADRVLGALVMDSSHLGRRFEETDLDLLSVVASTVGAGLDNLRLAARREATIAALEKAQAELLATQERLIQAEQMAALGRLASGIAHEVKNHLSPFMLADMIAKKYAEDEDIQDASEIMLEAQQHILGLVNEVRDFAQGSTRAHEPEPHDLVEVAEAILRFLRCDRALARADITLEAQAHPEVMLDLGRFRQVVINLLKNAVDAVPEDRAPQVRMVVHGTDEHAYLDVVDNGAGIAQADADQVFAPFFTTKGERGLGLGLDISRKIIRRHGGELGFTSEPGRGTTFRVRLPRHAC